MSGETMACLYYEGKRPSERHKFTIFVIGPDKTCKQDFKYRVGMTSNEQVASEAVRIAVLTSSSVAGKNCERTGWSNRRW